MATVLNMPQSVLLKLDDSRTLKSLNCSSLDHNGYLLEYEDRFQHFSSLRYYHVCAHKWMTNYSFLRTPYGMKHLKESVCQLVSRTVYVTVSSSIISTLYRSMNEESVLSCVTMELYVAGNW
jgi:hypothetical protein